jgi:perosamine synthetase
MPRLVPPAGAPLRMTEILVALLALVRLNRNNDEQLRKIATRLNTRYAFGASSGRAALSIVLKSLHRLRPDRNVIALPAYTCFSVPASIVRAGLKIHPVDVDGCTLDFDLCDLQEVPEKKLLCVVTSNLFGFPNDLPVVKQIANAKGAFTLDDAAQALGSTRNGLLAGSGGDVGIYSLGRGKALAALEGGLIVTDSDQIAEAIREEAKSLTRVSIVQGVRLLLEMMAYSIFLRPSLYWIPSSLPFLKLGVTEFDPGFPMRELHPVSLAILDPLFERLDEMNRLRRSNAMAISQALPTTSKFQFPRPNPNTLPAFVRLPVIARDKELRERVVKNLRKAGMSAGPVYPTAICEIQGLESHMAVDDFHRKGAELLSERLFTLPVNPFVTADDRRRMVDVLAVA